MDMYIKMNCVSVCLQAVKRAHVPLLSTAVLSDTVDDCTADQSGSNGTVSALIMSGYYNLTNYSNILFFQPMDSHMSVSTECHDGNTVEQSGPAVQQLSDSHLSTSQLILRRGLTVCAALALLAVGTTVHFLVPLPEILSLQTNFTTDWINTTFTPDHIFSTLMVPNEE